MGAGGQAALTPAGLLSPLLALWFFSSFFILFLLLFFITLPQADSCYETAVTL